MSSFCPTKVICVNCLEAEPRQHVRPSWWDLKIPSYTDVSKNCLQVSFLTIISLLCLEDQSAKRPFSKDDHWSPSGRKLPFPSHNPDDRQVLVCQHQTHNQTTRTVKLWGVTRMTCRNHFVHRAKSPNLLPGLSLRCSHCVVSDRRKRRLFLHRSLRVKHGCTERSAQNTDQINRMITTVLNRTWHSPSKPGT